MIPWKSSRPARAPRPILEQKMPLNIDTPLGLFEAKDRSRYLIADSDFGKYGLVLRHRYVPLFTAQILSEQLVAHGCWWGPCRVRLTSSYEGDMGPLDPGDMFIMEQMIGIECFVGSQTRLMPLGIVHNPGNDPYDSPSWTIEAARTPFRFCRRSATGAMSWGATPQEISSAWDDDDFIELDPRSFTT